MRTSLLFCIGLALVWLLPQNAVADDYWDNLYDLVAKDMSKAETHDITGEDSKNIPSYHPYSETLKEFKTKYLAQSACPVAGFETPWNYFLNLAPAKKFAAINAAGVCIDGICSKAYNYVTCDVDSISPEARMARIEGISAVLGYYLCAIESSPAEIRSRFPSSAEILKTLPTGEEKERLAKLLADLDAAIDETVKGSNGGSIQSPLQAKARFEKLMELRQVILARIPLSRAEGNSDNLEGRLSKVFRESASNQDTQKAAGVFAQNAIDHSKKPSNFPAAATLSFATDGKMWSSQKKLALAKEYAKTIGLPTCLVPFSSDEEISLLRKAVLKCALEQRVTNPLVVVDFQGQFDPGYLKILSESGWKKEEKKLIDPNQVSYLFNIEGGPLEKDAKDFHSLTSILLH